MPIIIKLFCEIEREGILTNSFYKASNRYPKQIGTQIYTHKENSRPNSSMNIHAKILNKIVANCIEQHS
jgi:hypothetical protein